MITMFLAPAHIALSKSPEKVTNSSIIKKFPVKFWRIVNSCKTGAVCWGFGGNSIRILKEKFEEEYLFGENKPFKTATFSSFIRQLNLYGFRKIVRPSIINEHGQKLNTSLVEYKHAMFLKGHPELLQRIQRNTKTQKRRERKNPSEKSTQSGTVCGSDPKIKREVTENGYGCTIQRHVIKEDGVSAFQDVTNLQDRTSGQSATSVSVPDQASPPSTLLSCTGQTLVSVQLPVTKQTLFRQPPNMARFDPGPYGHAANSKPSIQQMAPANINRPYSATADVPYPLQGHSRNTGPLDMIKLKPSLDSVKPSTGTGRQIHQVCEALPLVPNYTSNGPIQGLMLDTTHQQSSKIILNSDQKPQPVSCTAGTFPIQPRPVNIHPHGLAMKPSLISSMPKAMRHNVFPGNTRPVLYINKTPRVPIAPRPVMNTSRFQRPPPLRPQYTLYDNMNPSVQEKDNAECGGMATHPLLKPVRQNFDFTSVSCATDATIFSQYVLKPNIHLQSIPGDTLSASEHTESNVSLDDDGLVNLSHFKLSSTLKDIDAPCEDNMEVDNCNSHKLSPSYIINTDTSGVTTITSSLPATEQTCQVLGHNMKIPTKDTFSAPAIHDNNQILCSDDSKACSPSPATAFWELTTLTPPSTGPKRQLFKDSVTRTLTIPVSGLPREMFPVQTAAGEINDQSEAVITLETSEDGHVTGHLILPGKDDEGTKSTELLNASFMN